jgi:head-tail adaptor
MLAQRLRHRIAIQNQVETRADNGEPIGVSWSNLFSDVPAEIVPLSASRAARQFLAANAQQSEVVWVCTIRWMPDVAGVLRVVEEGIAYDVKAFFADATFRKELTLLLTQGVRYESLFASLPGFASEDGADEFIAETGGKFLQE